MLLHCCNASHHMFADRRSLLEGRRKRLCDAAPGGRLGPRGDLAWRLWISGGFPFLQLGRHADRLQRCDGAGEGGRPWSRRLATGGRRLACVSPQPLPPNLGSVSFSLLRKVPPPGTSGTTWQAGVRYRESADWDPLCLLAGSAEVLRGGSQPPSGRKYCWGKIYNLSGDSLPVSRPLRPLPGSPFVHESWKGRVCLGFCPSPSLTGKMSKKNKNTFH